jgi:phospholipase C
MKSATIVLAAILISCILLGASFASADISSAVVSSASTANPIKHIVIIFQENVSFDHYFATYPHAMNGANGSRFTSDQHTALTHELGSQTIQSKQ